MNARAAILSICRFMMTDPNTSKIKTTRNQLGIDIGGKMNGRNRSDIGAGAKVQVVQKQDQRTGKLTEGIVKDILTKSSMHSHGIKVRLTSGVVGRVKEIFNS